MRKTPTATTSRIYLDSFSGAAADLPPSKRTPGHALRALARDTRVSTFDMSESRFSAVAVDRRVRCCWRTEITGKNDCCTVR